MGIPFWIMILFCGLSLVLAWVMVGSEAKGNHIVTYLAKTSASICFMVAGFIAAAVSEGNKPLMLLLLGGLTLGMLGDIFLCRVHIAREEFWDILLTAGGVFFLSGHLCYFVSFFCMGHGGFQLPEFALILVLLVLVFTLMRTGRWKIPKKNWMNYMGYAFVSGLMLAAAIRTMLEDPLPEQIVLAAAAGVFILSDLALATWNYGKYHTTWMRYTCITLYYVAQILFVVGIWLN